ncbi:complex I subunit 5 family protein [Bdellovibrio sp. HCB209]|uniref:complex I subunit 5 family protein n=1 Tax=Bdellovibrio sp. HCB209 TaxID=3394354 RepID=UPI0039B5A10D
MIAIPLAICFLLGVLSFCLQKTLPWQRGLAVVGSLLVLVASLWQLDTVYAQGAQSLAFGNWQPPFGISFHVDLLSSVLIAVSSLVYFCGAVASVTAKIIKAELRGYYPLFHFLMLGILGAFSTGDLFNLYVWFEVLLLSSFFLVTAHGKQRAFAGGFKYALINILASLIFLTGVSLIYSGSGTLNLLQLKSLAGSLESSALFLGVSILTIAFLIKAAIFPFYFWLPASYPLTTTPVVAVFSGLLTKVGIYGLLRILAPFNETMPQSFIIALQILALASMIFGVFGALSQENMKGILAYHSASQLGYILLAFTLNTKLGIAACVFYMVHHMVVKTNLFLVVSAIETQEGSTLIAKVGGLLQKSPMLAVMFAIPALSLAGIPPLMGFWAKVFTIQGLFQNGKTIAVLISLAVSLLTLMSMLKIWVGVFWKPAPSEVSSQPLARSRKWIYLPLILLAAVSIFVGAFSQPGIEIAKQLAADVMNEDSI